MGECGGVKACLSLSFLLKNQNKMSFKGQPFSKGIIVKKLLLQLPCHTSAVSATTMDENIKYVNSTYYYCPAL